MDILLWLRHCSTSNKREKIEIGSTKIGIKLEEKAIRSNKNKRNERKIENRED